MKIGKPNTFPQRINKSYVSPMDFHVSPPDAGITYASALVLHQSTYAQEAEKLKNNLRTDKMGLRTL